MDESLESKDDEVLGEKESLEQSRTINTLIEQIKKLKVRVAKMEEKASKEVKPSIRKKTKQTNNIRQSKTSLKAAIGFISRSSLLTSLNENMPNNKNHGKAI